MTPSAGGSRARRLAASALGLVRFGNWWTHKIPPLLLVVYLEVIRRHVPLGAALAAIGLALWCVSCVAAYGHVLNDWCDIADDARAGKPNAMRELPPTHRAALCLGLLFAGFAVLAPFPNAWPARLLLALNVLWPTLYSLPSIRLKERGVLGVLSDAAGSHVTPTFFAFALVAIFSSASADGVVVAAVALWATVLGIKGILHHQIADRANDEAAGVPTFAGSLDVRLLSAMLARYNLLGEMPVSIFLTVVIAGFAPLAAAALAIYLGFECTKYALGFEFALSSDAHLRRASVPFANEMFYTLWLPLAAAVQLAVDNPWFAWLPLAHGLVFHQRLAAQAADTRAVASQLTLRFAHRRASRLRR